MYTGVTNDLERRLYEHYFGLGTQNAFTSKYKCYYLVWFEWHQYINNAISREKEIKGWLRSKKVQLIEEENSDWRFLNTDIMEWPPVKIIEQHVADCKVRYLSLQDPSLRSG